ncbi:MAG TPA: hypothetical protein VIM88_03660 [Sulfurovum sp.]
MHEMITHLHYKIYTLRGKQIMLDTLVLEAKKTDEKAMGFLKP